MWEFLDRLISIAIPRIRDFRGLNPRAFDGRGNYSLGVREQLIFPEIDYDSIDEVRGLDIAITTTAATDEEGFELLLGLGMPFAQEGRPGPVDTAAEDEEERRKEEARLRAEAEQAALEQLKEENPEAYAKPERPEEGEEGEEGEAARAATTLQATKVPRTEPNGEDVTERRQQRKPKYKTRGVQPLPPLRPLRAPTTASSASAGSACARPLTTATSPG